MFNFAEDEESFNPAASSNLASLFGSSMTVQNNYDSNLSYTAPKQPRTQEKVLKPQSSVLCSKFVNVFKLIDNEHVNQGKCGIAIIGIETLNVYELILYKSKQDIITRSKLKAGFIFHRQSNNFAAFCDDQQQPWSVHFENEREVEDFAREIDIHGGQIVKEIEQKLCDKDSDSFSDTSTNKAKANILSRMAKMGQSILPKADLPPSESDNSDCCEKTIVKKTKKIKQPKEKLDQTVNLPISQSEFVVINGQAVPITNLQQNYSVPLWGHSQAISDPFNIFVAENRTHNCEMRMNLSQLSLKLDRIFEEMNKSKSVSHPTEANLKVVDNEETLSNLKTDYKILENKLKTANEVISNLTVENESYRTTLSMQEEKINCLQEELIKYNELKVESEKQSKTISVLEETLATQQPNLEMLTQFYDTHKEKNYSKIIEELNESNDKLQMKFADAALKRDLFSKKLKLAMNSLYQTMMETFSDENITFRALEIKEVLSKNLKTTTFNVIEEFTNDFKDNEESA